MKTLTDRNIFIINNQENLLPDKHVAVYLPLSNYVRIVSENKLQELKKTLESRNTPNDLIIKEIIDESQNIKRRINSCSHNLEDITTLILLPNNKCNFRCSYCYSSMGRSIKELDIEKGKRILEYFISEGRCKNKKLTLLVLGGGEPLLSWDLLKLLLEYAVELNQRRNGELYISIISNGSIINDDILNFCKKYNIGLCMSFDILEDVQNKQRGHYQLVCDNINMYTEKGVDVGITTVITENNIFRMHEMIDSMISTIPLVKKVTFKPLIPNEYLTSIGSREEYYNIFVKEFLVARKYAEQLGVFLTCPFYNAISSLNDRFCSGKFVVSNNGDITSCNCISSPKEDLFDDFIFGHIGNNDITFDSKKYDSIISHNSYHKERCRHCALKWHCAGGCYVEMAYMNDRDMDIYCNAMQFFLLEYLLEKHNIKHGK